MSKWLNKCLEWEQMSQANENRIHSEWLPNTSTHTHTHTHMHVHKYTYTSTYVCTHINTHIYKHTHMHPNIHSQAHLHMDNRAHQHAHTCTCYFICIRTRLHIHKYSHRLDESGIYKLSLNSDCSWMLNTCCLVLTSKLYLFILLKNSQFRSTEQCLKIDLILHTVSWDLSK